MKTKVEAKQFLPGRFEIKAKDQAARTFEGSLSTSHLDLGGWFSRDIVWPGAFKRTLDHFKNDADGYIPLLDSHDPYSIFNTLGHLLEGEEQLTGETLVYDMANSRKLRVPEMLLWTKWQVIDGVDGDRVLDRLRPGSVRKMSMGYETVRSDEDELEDGDKVRNLREVRIMEGSLVVFPMNPAAAVDLTSVKALLDAARAGTLTDEQKTELRALLDPPPADPAPELPGPAHYEQADALKLRIRLLGLRRSA